MYKYHQSFNNAQLSIYSYMEKTKENNTTNNNNNITITITICGNHLSENKSKYTRGRKRERNGLDVCVRVGVCLCV